MGAYHDWPVVRWGRAHRFLVDALFAAAITVAALASHLLQHDIEGRRVQQPTWWTVPLVIVACAPIAWRRIRTIPAVIATVVLQVVLEIFYVNGPAWIGVAVMLYALGSYAEGRARLRALVVVTVLVAGLLVLGLLDDEAGVGFAEAIGLIAILAVCYLTGDVLRRRRNELATLAARAERAERERELLAGQRVVEERARIARELHDIVAHSVSVMVIQATAARRNLDRDPAAAAELLGNVEAMGRQTMGELRQILGVLRDTTDQVAPTTPVLDDLESLVQSLPELDVHVERTGSLAAVPTGVALSAYRVVQEALTNVHRHAGPGVTVDVRVDCMPDEVEVSVTDNGRGASTRPDQHGTNGDHHSGGYGLIGMAERVAAFGGTLRTGPRRSGGWEVRAAFPVARVDDRPRSAVG